MLDFTLIKTGEDFELLCEDLLQAMKFRIDSRPGRGPDQGKDIIAIREVRDDLYGLQEQRFLVECKHHAVSGQSVKESDTQNIVERTLSHQCDHYLLITSTIPSESVKNQIEGIDKNPRINLKASFWAKHDLAEKLHEHPEVWELHTGQYLPKKLTPQTFKTLDSVLDRSSEFFPNRKLFDENLIYFPAEEHQLMQEIQTILLTHTKDRMALLYGDPASGKTVMGLAIAKEMEKQSYTVLYQRLTAKTKLDALWPDFATYGDQKVLFIVDDCHLNMEIATGIYYRFDNIQNAACLLISRKLPKKFRFSMDFDYLDIFEKLEEEDRCFELDIALDTRVINKMSGIIQRYKAYYERIINRSFIVGNEERIIQNVHRNFLSLYFYLSFWPEAEQLDQLDEKLVLEKMYYRYLDNNANRPYLNLLLKYAALYQYEIQFEPSQEEDFEGIEVLTAQGLLEFDPETEYYAFCHSDFARLLLKSYASRSSFQRRYYGNFEQFTIQQVKTYLLSFDDYPANLSEVFSNIVTNKGIDVFTMLLGDDKIKDQVIRFYQNTDSADNLVRFLYYLKLHCLEQLEHFLGRLTIENPSIKDLFLKVKNVLAPFISLLKIIIDVDKIQYENFLNLFNSQEIKDMLINSSLHQIGSSMCYWNKFDLKSAKAVFNSINTYQFLGKVKDHSLSQLGSDLSNLNHVDSDKTREIFDSLELEGLIEKTKAVEFGQLGEALNRLNSVNSDKTRKVFDSLELDELVEKAKKVEFGTLGKALNELNFVNSDKTREIFDSLELEGLVEKTKAVEFGQLGEALNRLNPVNSDKTRKVFDSLELDELVEKAKKVEFGTLGKALNELNSVNSDKTRKVFDSLELDELVEKAKKVKFSRLQKGLSELRLVSQEKAGKIWESIELKLVVPDAINTKYITFLYGLPGLAQASPTKMREFILQLPDDFLFQFDYLKALYNFNRLLFVFHTCECSEAAIKLIVYAQENVHNFIRSKKLKDLASFFSICAHYFDIKNIIFQNRKKWFGKVKYGEPSEIPYFIRVINDQDTELALELLDYVRRNVEGEDILANCFYQLALSFAEQENFTESTAYLKKAIFLFQKSGDNSGLCYTTFALAQNAFKLNNIKKARQLAEQALSYARSQDIHDLQKEIESFIATELS